MARLNIKCIKSSCYKRGHPDPDWWLAQRKEAALYEATAQLVCPDHVEELLADVDRYAANVPLGEVVAELAKDKPRWRVVWVPR